MKINQKKLSQIRMMRSSKEKDTIHIRDKALADEYSRHKAKEAVINARYQKEMKRIEQEYERQRYGH